MSDERRDRLPKWAQRELGRLERDLADVQERLAAGPADSVVFADPYDDAPRPLGDAAVRFHFGRHRVVVRVEEDGLEINGSRMLIEPRAANAIVIRGAA